MSEIKVLYNADCAVCSREIDHYARITATQSVSVRYDDLNDCKKRKVWGISAEDAAKQLHVRKDGRTYRGVPAFIALWESLPRYRWLAKLVALPGIYAVANLTYDKLLAPALYNRHLKRLAKQHATNDRA